MKRVEYKRFTSKRKFGVELEVGPEKDRSYLKAIIANVSDRQIVISDWALSNGNDYWHVKYDSTCGPKGKGYDNGWEVASYVSSGYKDIVQIAKVATALQDSGVTINPNCGLHVHVDMHDFTTDEAAVLVARWIKIEQTLCGIVPPDRLKSKYCRLVSEIAKKKLDFKKQYEAPKFWRIIRPTNYHVHDNTQKKVALNMVNFAAAIAGYQNRSTVEFRFPEGTLNGDDVKNWARIFLGFVDAAKKAEMPESLTPAPDAIEEIMIFFGLEDAENFYILSKGLLQAKVWLLKRLIAHSPEPVAKKARKKLQIVTEITK